MKKLWQGFKQLIRDANEKGIAFPLARDSVSKGPSSTLYFTYMTFMLAFVANICLLVHDVVVGTYVAIGFWALALVFYLMRRIDTFRVDIDDGEVMLKSSEEEPQEKRQKRPQLGENE